MESLKTIITLTYPHEAHIVKAYLESQRVEVLLKDELTTQVNNFYSNAIGGVKVIVKESDYEIALNLLKEGGYIRSYKTKEQSRIEIIRKDKTTDTGICPFCGSDNIGKRKDPNILTVIVCFLLGAIFPIYRKTYKCYQCEKEWKYST
jgi:hypothetical protein